MPLILSLIIKLQTDFPSYRFMPSQEFRWSPDEHTIYYDETADDAPTLLHELSHALLAHVAYTRDIELIELERDAWDYAKRMLAPQYKIAISEDIVDDSLDTYRDWLHARSTCPTCRATGLQVKKYSYKCIACGQGWHVNDARTCTLRRYADIAITP